MASSVDIVNLALTLLGEERISSIDDDVKPAREAKAVYDIARDAALAGYDWAFAFDRASLSALADAPAFEYSLQYQLPSDCLRLRYVGDHYVGIDMTDYRGAPTEEFTIEGRKILTNLSAPLHIKYVTRVTDPGQYSANFVAAFGAKLATYLAEPITQSDTKRDRAEAQFKTEISLAVRANAIQLPPKKLPDDEWLLSRL